MPVKIRDVHKIERKHYISINDFGSEDKEKYPIYVSKIFCESKHVDLLLIIEGEKKHYALIEDFNTFIINTTQHDTNFNMT